MAKITCTTMTAICAAVMAAPALAQKANLTQRSTADVTLRYEIATTVEVTRTSESLLDGEVRDLGGRGGRGGRGGGGGNGDTSVTQTASFNEGPGWREYLVLEAVSNSGGNESKIAGALAGKKVFISAANDGSLSVTDGQGEDAQPVAANLTRSMPAKVDLGGFLPASEVEVGEEFDLSEGFLQALGSVMHPVQAERAQRGRGGQARGGRGGQGGRAGRGGGRRGGQGGRGRGSNPNDSLIAVVNAEIVSCKASGSLESIEGNLAKFAIKATISGAGTAEELGLGGGGGRRGGAAAEAKGSANLSFAGSAVFNTETGLFESIDLGGEVDLKSDSKRMVNFGGNEGEMETKSTTKGKLTVKVDCKAVK